MERTIKQLSDTYNFPSDSSLEVSALKTFQIGIDYNGIKGLTAKRHKNRKFEWRQPSS